MVDPSGRPASEERRGRLYRRRITLCVTGSIAAYKAVLVLRQLQSEDAEIDVVLTASAERFVGAATFSGLTGRPVLNDMFDPSLGGELHVDIAARSDLIVIVPATADLLARLAAGRADDLVSAIALCARRPLLAVPAMHPSMWEHPATQRNVQTLHRDGRMKIVGPIDGPVASGDSGMGRMAEPDQVVTAVLSELASGALKGRHIVVTAGPTIEDIDPVRFISNRSSGKMGFAIAERAAARGAKVTLIAGPVSLPTPPGVQRIDVRSASAMQSALWQSLQLDVSNADALIMAAAVGDYRPAQTHSSKLKRDSERGLTLELVANDDILAQVGQARSSKRPVLVGFALETESDAKLLESARSKLAAKRVDLIIANRASEVLGKDENRATLVDAQAAQALGQLPKAELADRIIDWVQQRLEERSE
jgi:phosphopantothenoylcysteine decarboxylase/phosphopantothenate--cysteine ligase